MAKAKKMFECQACGLVTPKWMGKCTSCGGWDSFIELREQKEEKGPGNAAKKRSSSHNVASTATSITEIEIDSIEIYWINKDGKIYQVQTYFGPSEGRTLDPFFSKKEI